MEFLIIVALIALACHGFHVLCVKDTEGRMPAPCNPSLYYIYTLDEFYELRKKFDELIEKDWEAYREDKITTEEYKRRCESVVREIIGSDLYPGYGSLCELAIRKAAYRIEEKGYAPGIADRNYISRKIVSRGWAPAKFNPDFVEFVVWNVCVGRKDDLLSAAPNENVLSCLGIEKYRRSDGTYYYEAKDDGYMFKYYGRVSNTESITATVDELKRRRYDGHTYRNLEDRSVQGLSKEEINKKYMFVRKFKNEPFKFLPG